MPEGCYTWFSNTEDLAMGSKWTLRHDMSLDATEVSSKHLTLFSKRMLHMFLFRWILGYCHLSFELLRKGSKSMLQMSLLVDATILHFNI